MPNASVQSRRFRSEAEAVTSAATAGSASSQRIPQNLHLLDDFSKDHVLSAVDGGPVNTLVLEFRVMSNLYVSTVVAQLEQSFFGPLEQRRVAVYVEPLQLIRQVMRQVIAMSPQGLDRFDVIVVDCLHEVSKVKKARFEVVLVPSLDVYLIRLEGAGLERRVAIEELDGLDDEASHQFVSKQDKARVGQGLGQICFRETQHFAAH